MRDLELRQRMTVRDKAPELALVVTVDQAFIHCGKCMLRSGLWRKDEWPDIDGLPTQAQCLVEHAKLDEPLEEVQASIEKSRKTQLY